MEGKRVRIFSSESPSRSAFEVIDDDKRETGLIAAKQPSALEESLSN